MNKIASRYREGLVIAEWNSHTGSESHPPDGVSTAEDYIVKRLVVQASQDPKIPSFVDLVAFVTIEVISIEDGEDEGSHDGLGYEVYRLPFPYDKKTRKQVLRRMQAQPHFHRTV